MAFETAWFVLLVIGVLVFILAPVLARPEKRQRTGLDERELLAREKRAALMLVRELEFDYHSGKILEADYRSYRAEAERRAVEVLHRLDALDTAEDAVR